MVLRPPRSTLFPTRRSSDLGHGIGARVERGEEAVERNASAEPAEARDEDELELRDDRPLDADEQVVEPAVVEVIRSEEHTSELQSRRDLVCRLLLEKKKNTT